MIIQESKDFKIGGPRATYVLVICSLLNAVAYADWQVMAVVLQPMKIALGLSDAQIGAINTAYSSASSCARCRWRTWLTPGVARR